jgi:predicted nucleic acid-binding protein
VAIGQNLGPQETGAVPITRLQFDHWDVEEAMRDRTTVRLAERHGLTVYDAVYLELALRHGLPLATLYQELRAARIE